MTDNKPIARYDVVRWPSGDGPADEVIEADFGDYVLFADHESALALKDAELEKFKTIMMAAAVEIKEHWEAHCDAEGYGPVNLLRRLESGLHGGGYAYTAEDWIACRARIAELETRLELVTKERDHIQRKLETTQHENKEAFASWRDFQQLASERYEENKSLRAAIREIATDLWRIAEERYSLDEECGDLMGVATCLRKLLEEGK